MVNDSSVRSMEILLVEDGLLDARITIHALRRSNVHHRLTLVRTAAEAKQFLRREGVFARAPRPDLLLLDLKLPDGDGISVLREMRKLQDGSGPETPVVVLTSAGDQATRQRCEALEVDGFITKPVDEDQFLRVIRDQKRLMVFSTPTLAAGA